MEILFPSVRWLFASVCGYCSAKLASSMQWLEDDLLCTEDQNVVSYKALLSTRMFEWDDSNKCIGKVLRQHLF